MFASKKFSMAESVRINAFEAVKPIISNTTTRSIDRVHISSLTSSEFLKQYLHKGVPVILAGLLEIEPAWTLEFLCQQLGQQAFPVRQYSRDRYQQDKRSWTSSGSGVPATTMLFSQYADLIRSGEAAHRALYLARCSLQQTALANAPVLEKAEQWMQLELPATSLNLWVGSAGHTSCLHYDPMDSVLMQLHGAKQIMLFPPNQTYNLYPIPVLKQLRYGLQLRPVYSQVYPEQPDFQSFPKLKAALAHCRSSILNPGEILFLPAGWWHEITAVGSGVTCSVNRFWHVLPVARAISSWNKWRAHLGSALAAPHVAWNLLSAAISGDRPGELSKLVQRL